MADEAMTLVEVSWLEEILKDVQALNDSVETAANQMAEIHNMWQSRLLDLLHHGFNAKAEGKTAYSAGLLMGYLIMTGEKQVG